MSDIEFEPPWLEKNTILDYFNNQNPVASYNDFIGSGNDKITKKFYNKKYLHCIFGNENFKTKKTSDLYEDQLPESATDLRSVKTKPSLTSILRNVADFYQVELHTLHLNKLSIKNIPRHMAITVSRKIYGYN